MVFFIFVFLSNRDTMSFRQHREIGVEEETVTHEYAFKILEEDYTVVTGMVTLRYLCQNGDFQLDVLVLV